VGRLSDFDEAFVLLAAIDSRPGVVRGVGTPRSARSLQGLVGIRGTYDRWLVVSCAGLLTGVANRVGIFGVIAGRCGQIVAWPV